MREKEQGELGEVERTSRTQSRSVSCEGRGGYRKAGEEGSQTYSTILRMFQID